jgi:hypothetical protein
MDLATAARIKANSRLKPAKDVSVAYAELLSNTNPDLFPDLQNRLVLAIDSAAAEYQILINEVQQLESLIGHWKSEHVKSRRDIEAYQEEITALDGEGDGIAARLARLSRLNEMKAKLVRANIAGLANEIVKQDEENEEMEAEIAAVEVANEKRSLGLDEIGPDLSSLCCVNRPREIWTDLMSDTDFLVCFTLKICISTLYIDQPSLHC